MAKQAAQALLRHGMNASAAARGLRPHLTELSARKTGWRMMRAPAVQRELDRLANAGGHDAQEFIETQWDWLRGQDKRQAITAARTLGRLYVGKSGQPQETAVRITGLEALERRMMGSCDTPE